VNLMQRTLCEGTFTSNDEKARCEYPFPIQACFIVLQMRDFVQNFRVTGAGFGTTCEFLVSFQGVRDMIHGNLDRLLTTLGVAVEAFAVCEVRRGLRLIFTPIKAIEVHYVLAGTMHLMVPGAKPVICQPGSVVIVPPTIAHSVAADDNPQRDVIANQLCSMTRDGLLLCDAADGNAGDLRLACGFIRASFSGSFGLLDYMAEPIAENLSDAEVVHQAFATMLEEIGNPGLGSRALTGALMKVCLVKVLRGYFDGSGTRSTLLGSLHDPRLGNAVIAVLDKPAAAHTVASLASSAAMSRSAFARAFTEAFALTPMEFVAKTRLHHAAELLRSTTISIKAIAGSIGFASRSHFSHAFRDAYGTSPRNFRKMAMLHEPAASKPLREEFAVEQVTA
jgi:AraC family transcriptional regulator, activator of mtrCDE